MSQFVTKLRESQNGQGDSGRDGIEWPTPVGTWKQSESVNRLETFANNLDVSQAPGDTDLLNSVPTPWARLLLFESALYKDQHPAHKDVEDQWRGLLGVIALAGPLRLDLEVKSVTLSQQVSQHNSRIAKTFVDLRPHNKTESGDEESDKWDDFQMVLVDKVVLGATSPRTLVFTGVAHQCPTSIPFRSAQGRLSDPVAYYKKFNDVFYLGLMARWIGGLIAALEQSPQMKEWMGTPPTAPGASQRNRMESLLDRLRAWQGELNGVAPASIMGSMPSRFTLAPYTLITGLPQIMQESKSDLFVSGHKDTIVCFRPENSSRLLSAFGQELVNEPLQVFNGRWIQANQSLPLPLTFLPNTIKKIEDPAALFEDILIQVALPDNPEAVYDLSVGDKNISQKRYLYPFKVEILKYFSAAEIAQYTEIVPNPQANSLRVELKIPVENKRSVRVTREYPLDTGVIADTETVTAELAAWPNFTCPTWTRYFYFKTVGAATAGRRPVDFEPTISSTARSSSSHTWYATREPVKAFVGSVDGKSGLLLLRDNEISRPLGYWKVGVDFGSTHTRAFSLNVERQGDDENGYEFVTSQDADIKPVQFSPRAHQLTYGDPKVLRNTYLALIGALDPPSIAELKTLMMIPEPNNVALDSWLPREGYVYAHWLYDGNYDPNRLHYNLKWNSHKNDYDLRAFLRCLLLMIQAEATSAGAQVVLVMHTYPSVFTPALVAKHNGEWSDLENYLNLGVLDPTSRVTVQPATITEAVAVCRHLEAEQDAPPVSNTISLDVGGSTTDMAVWAQQKLEIQESVKLASGILGRYLQSPDAQDFLKWVETVMQTAPHNLKAFSVSNFASKPSGYSLMFTNLLSLTELRGRQADLIAKVNGAQEARHFMSHIIYVFSGVLYYAGLLARKAGLPQQHDTYNIYFCGKGGTLVKWIEGYQVLAQEMFEAGLLGPAEQGEANSPTVEARISRLPKQEVGRGLLAESHLQGKQKGKRLGL
ncbi:MAG: hypothetical protein QOD00_3108, partial [Blastocatellia bacterium]|nr:hypothetical protein [Blastocatellia bacterium]